MAGGIYQPDAENLAKVRQEIDYNTKDLRTVVAAKRFRKLFGGFDNFDKLKTAPKGYPKDHPEIEWLKLKSFIVSKPFTDKEIADKKFTVKVAAVCREIKPLNDFIREAIV